jgi:hypothetical protein
VGKIVVVPERLARTAPAILPTLQRRDTNRVGITRSKARRPARGGPPQIIEEPLLGAFSGKVDTGFP